MDHADHKPEYLSIHRIIWWILAYLLAIAVALLSWSWCYNIFSFPENERNFKILSKLGYIGNIETYTPLNAPAAKSADAQYLYELLVSLEPPQLEKLNQNLLRGYITNYEKIPVYRYLQGEFRITSVRALTDDDFLSPGIFIQARAYIKAEENDLSSPYPMEIDYYIPTDTKAAKDNFQVGDLLPLEKSKHCATILHTQLKGSQSEPTLHAAVVPLAYNIYISPDRKEFPLATPDKININRFSSAQ